MVECIEVVLLTTQFFFSFPGSTYIFPGRSFAASCDLTIALSDFVFMFCVNVNVYSHCICVCD